jgi:hypothetical protein
MPECRSPRRQACRFRPLRNLATDSTISAVGNGKFAFTADVTGLQTLNQTFRSPLLHTGAGTRSRRRLRASIQAISQIRRSSSTTTRPTILPAPGSRLRCAREWLVNAEPLPGQRALLRCLLARLHARQRSAARGDCDASRWGGGTTTRWAAVAGRAARRHVDGEGQAPYPTIRTVQAEGFAKALCWTCPCVKREGVHSEVRSMRTSRVSKGSKH